MPAHPATVVTAAWTVREDADGTVTLDVRQFADPARLQQVLRADGINAFVGPIQWTTKELAGRDVTYAACTHAHTNHAPESVQQAVVTPELPQGWVIDPSAMPSGSALFVTGGPADGSGERGGLRGADRRAVHGSLRTAVVVTSLRHWIQRTIAWSWSAVCHPPASPPERGQCHLRPHAALR